MRFTFKKEIKSTDKHGYTDLDVIEIVEHCGISNWRIEERLWIIDRYKQLILNGKVK